MTQALAPLKIAIIAGEASGDHLGADLLNAMRAHISPRPLELVGIGGEGMTKQGLNSLFDYSELSIIGISAVVKQLPKLLWRIHQTTQAIIAADPDLLIIIDSPDFTHRVAKRIKAKLPGLKIINYVCPTVWAWKPERAPNMVAYIDHVLAIFPFEPDIVRTLNGPNISYIGHRLMENHGLLAARAQQLEKVSGDHKSFLLLPGSRSSEIKSLLPIMKSAAIDLSNTYNKVDFFMPTLPRFESYLREQTKDWPIKVNISGGELAKWEAFAKADAALAASGTILLELALARVPCVSVYKPDFLLQLLAHKITAWSAALPNLIVGYPAISEQYGDAIRPIALSKRLQRLGADTKDRHALLYAFDEVFDRMRVDETPSHKACSIIMDILQSTQTS